MPLRFVLRAAAVCLLAAPCAPAGAATEAADPFAERISSYLLLIDGVQRWARSPDAPRPPASLTKLMTALLVLEADRLESVARVSRDAARETGTRLGLKEGERLRVGDLLAAVVLKSANDACHVLADHHAGSEAKFVAWMNERARRLGLRRTHFVNACGHDHPGQVSTARELAVLAQTVMAQPAYATLAETVKLTIATQDKRSFALENSNQLVGRYGGAIGVKTGFTSRAGPCVVALAERDGRRVLLVMLNASDRWWAAVRMLDRAFESPPPAG